MEDIEKDQKIKIRFSVSSIRSHEALCDVRWVETDRICLIFPEEYKKLSKYLHEGRELEAIAYTDKGIFVFDSIVIDSPYSNDFVIEFPEEKEKIQRREYVRAPIKLDIQLTKGGATIKGNTINIGGGGIRFTTEKDLEVKQVWNFSMTLPKWSKPVYGTGEVLYNIKQDNSNVSVLKFSYIEESDRNKIIKLCFEIEASQLKIRAKSEE